MIKIYIQGLKDGFYDIDMMNPVTDVDEIFPEFFGNITVKGKLRKFGKRFTFTGSIVCNAKLICDLSLKEYIQEIRGELNTSFLADSVLFRLHEAENSTDDETERIIHEDDKFIDISPEVREELAISIPMKRISPEFADKDFEDLYPQYSTKYKSFDPETVEEDQRWSVLKKLKLN